MKTVIICTVGTSLKSNLMRAVDKEFPAYLEKSNIQGVALKLADMTPD